MFSIHHRLFLRASILFFMLGPSLIFALQINGKEFNQFSIGSGLSDENCKAIKLLAYALLNNAADIESLKDKYKTDDETIDFLKDKSNRGTILKAIDDKITRRSDKAHNRTLNDAKTKTKKVKKKKKRAEAMAGLGTAAAGTMAALMIADVGGGDAGEAEPLGPDNATTLPADPNVDGVGRG